MDVTATRQPAPDRAQAALAAVATARATVELQRWPLPDVVDDDGLLDVEACGVCGTDLELFRREALGRDLGPLILGHETVGRIRALGPLARRRWGVGIGDRVAVEEFLPCGRCELCRTGHYRICPRTDLRSGGRYLRYGAVPVDEPPHLWGGFAEVMYLHPDALVYPVPDTLPADVATLFVPVSNGIRWVLHEAGGQLGESLAIFGPGAHGLGCVLAADAAGLSPIVVFGLSSDKARLELALRLGADAAVPVDVDDPVAVARDVVGDRGFDVVVDVTPSAPEVVTTAMRIAAARGRVVLAGSKEGRPTSDFDADLVLRRELRLLGVRGHDRRSVVPALELLATTTRPVAELCTHTVALADVGTALRSLVERSAPDMVHVTVVPSGTTDER